MQPETFDGTFGPIDCVADPETRQKQIDSAVARKLRVVVKRKERKGKVAIVASGPSATDYIPMLKEWDGEIWAINRAFEWLRHRGVNPTAFVGIDPEWFLVECLPNKPENVTYFLAAQVHPCVFDHLKDRDVRLWYMGDDQVKLPWGAYQIYGGSTCLSRAPNLAWAQGYREVHVFGGDSSFTHKTHVHGGDLPEGAIDARVGDKSYKTTRAMMAQALEYVEQMPEWARMKPALSVSIYGEGLMPALVDQAMNSGNYFEYLRSVNELGKKVA
jgi:hypothetical protein